MCRDGQADEIEANYTGGSDDCCPETINPMVSAAHPTPGKLSTALFLENNSNNSNNTSSEASNNPNHFTPGRRGSILASANKDMISCLNKMFSGGVGSSTSSNSNNNQMPFGSPTAKTPSSRMSMFTAGNCGSGTAMTPGTRRASVTMGGADGNEMTEPLTIDNIAKRTQSKLLKVSFRVIYF